MGTSKILTRRLAHLLLIAALLATAPAQQAQSSFTITPDIQAALDSISADSLKGHLSFIASDLLGGRDTPSPGLDIAAEYIAAQFRRAGLEPAGDDGYFQTANWLVAERQAEGFKLTLSGAGSPLSVPGDRVSTGFPGSLDLTSAPVFKLAYNDEALLAKLTPERISGRVVLTEMPDIRRRDRSTWMELFRAQNAFVNRMRELKAAAILAVNRESAVGAGFAAQRLIDPENRRPAPRADLPMVSVHDAAFIERFDAMQPGAGTATVSLLLAAPVEKPVKLRNVIGVLRGSDPVLRDSYVLVTAHYDHVGKGPEGEGDYIYNGANDDGSGTVSVIELATALSKLKQRPKRSIVFMTVFGEEKGLLGSRYYGRNPVFPIEKTVANINLEQVGRTDSTEGSQVNRASLTGFDFSDVGTILQEAGRMTGIEVYKHPTNSDAFFGRSDNQALADQGVPAHTLCVAYEYSDYHGLGDHWDKIDYENMARTNRMLAVGILMIAENPQAPRWNESNPKAAKYVQAWRARHGGQQ